jgi:integrase
VDIIKLPNGYGTVYKLSGKRRNPYIARKTVGWETDEATKKVKQILKTIGYYKTKSEALIALAEYNNDPYDLVVSKYTFSEIYEKWYDDTFNDNTNSSTIKNYKNAYNHCKPIYNKKMVDLRLKDLQPLLNDCPNDFQSVGRIKTLLNEIYKWCIRKEYLRKNYAEMIIVPTVEVKTKERRVIEKEHIQRIWDVASSENLAAVIALQLIYSGVRPNELFNLNKDDVHIEEQYFDVKKSKTKNGIRKVPIADKVLPFWKEALKRSKCDKAITTLNGLEMNNDNYRKRYWSKLMNDLHLDYTVYETRHTCNTLLVMSDCNPTVRKKIMGHKSEMDLGEKVYTHLYIEKLLEAINKI